MQAHAFAALAVIPLRVTSFALPHPRTMTGLTFSALIGAGLFTLLAGRVMYQVVFGL